MRHVGTLALIASSAAAAGGAAFFARERLSRVSAGTCANPAVHPGSAAEAGRIARVAERLRRVWPEVTGESAPMPRAALEIALAQAFLESGVAEAGGGGWWKDKTDAGGGNMVGSGNLGARQCGANDEGGDYYTCVEYGDSRPNPDGTQTFFPAKFRYYKAGTCGGKQRDAGDCAAYEFLRDIVRQWPALAELKSGDVLGYAMRQGPKYRSGDPPNQKVFGREYKGGNGYYGGFGATMQERVGGYARAIASHLPAVASALGHDRIYACVPPEVAAGGKTHAAVSGTLETVYGALHLAGALPRARAIPGSGGSAIVWYVQPAPASEDTMKAQDIVALLGTGAPLPTQAPPVQGIGTTAAVAVASAAVAAVVGTGIEHHLKEKEKEKERVAADTAKAPGSRPRGPYRGPVRLPRKEPTALPALDEDRGSLAALKPLSLPALEQDRGPIALPKALVAPSVPAALPALDPDRGSVAAIQSGKLTREDMKQMFPTYTDAQIDEALQQMQPAEPLKFEPATTQEAARRTFHGLSDDMRDDLARLAFLEARDASGADREHLLSIASDLSGEEHVTQEAAAASDAYVTAQHERARNVALTMLREGIDARARREAAASATSANVEGAGLAVAVTAGGLAAGAALAALLSHVAKASDAPAAPPAPAAAPAASVPPASVAKPATAAPKADATPSPAVLAEKNVQRINDELQHLYETAPRDTFMRITDDARAQIEVKERELAQAKEQAAALKGMKVSGVDLAQDGLAAALRAPSPSVDRVRFALDALRRAEMPVIEGGAASTIISEASKTARMYTIYRTVTGTAMLLVIGLLVWGATKSGAFRRGADDAKRAERDAKLQKLQGSLAALIEQQPRDMVAIAGVARQIADIGEETGELPMWSDLERAAAASRHMSAQRMSRLLSVDSLGAKKDEPDDIDKALATGSDAADVATGLLQAVAAGKKIAERGAAQEDPKCRRLIRAWVEKHPILARVTSPDLRTLAGVDIGDADVETFKIRYVDEVIRRRAALGDASADCAVTPEEDRAVLLSLGARKNDFEVFAESVSHWAPDKVLPAAAAAFKTAAPAAASMYRGGGALADLSNLLPQQIERSARPPAPPPEPVVIEKGVSVGATAAIATGAAAAAAIVAAIVSRK